MVMWMSWKKREWTWQKNWPICSFLETTSTLWKRRKKKRKGMRGRRKRKRKRRKTSQCLRAVKNIIGLWQPGLHLSEILYFMQFFINNFFREEI
jgi:hypothetical protein